MSSHPERTQQTADTATNTSILDHDSLNDYLVEHYYEKVNQLPREWELTKFGAHHLQTALSSCSSSRKAVEFSLMTYNILSQDLLDCHPYLYSRSQAQSLDWKQRRRTLVAEIAFHSPDILSLQEVHRDHFLEYIKPRLTKLGYTGSYHKRSGDKSDGCATLWKKDRFQLLQANPVDYCRGGLLDRDNIALLVVLQPLREDCKRENTSPWTHDKIVVANTHLLFNPRRGDVKLAQLMILLAEIEKCAYLGSSPDTAYSDHPGWWDAFGAEHYCPVIMTGDFNMEPQSDLYKFIVSGMIDYEDLLIREMAGQEEGSYGRNNWLQRDFLSASYGVSDFCQYHSVVVERLRQSYQAYSQKSCTRTFHSDCSESHQLSIQDFHSCCNEANEEKRDNYQHVAMCLEDNSHSSESWQAEDCHCMECPPLMPSMTGRLLHRLNLISAYRHKVQRLGDQVEVTTHHSRAACTVDFVFYSVDYKDVSVQNEEVQVNIAEEGHLKLVGRYGLMSGTELDDIGGIPNSVFPSDHLCLITRFLLQ